MSTKGQEEHGFSLQPIRTANGQREFQKALLDSSSLLFEDVAPITPYTVLEFVIKYIFQ